MSDKKELPCPCKSGKTYQQCCLPLHNKQKTADSCEQLMRSRFSAFVYQLGQYLFDTYHSDFRKELTAEKLSEKTADWVNLDIIATQSLKESGFVEFKAWYKEDNKLCCFHEKSNFLKEQGQWFYCDGTFYSSEKSGKITRNALCPCDSGKKYKKCCS